jgi:hypothetical protein
VVWVWVVWVWVVWVWVVWGGGVDTPGFPHLKSEMGGTPFLGVVGVVAGGSVLVFDLELGPAGAADLAVGVEGG